MKKYRIGMLVLALALVLSLLCGTAFADNGTIRVEASFTDGTSTTVVPGMPFKLYKVAAVDEYGKVTATQSLVALPSEISGSDVWKNALEELGRRAGELGAPLATGKTDAQGKLSFPGSDPGVYLIVADPVTLQDGTKYSAVPVWAQLPMPTQNPAGWDYNPVVKVVNPKLVKVDPAKIVVEIKWDDKDPDLTRYRPKEVTVQLYDGDTLKDTKVVRPNTAGVWTHTWTVDPAPGHDWKVVEIRPEGYKITDITVVGNKTTITNKPNTEIIDPPIRKLIDGTGAPSTSKFSFRMEVLSYPDGVTPIPMPAESNGRVKTVTLTAAEATAPEGYEFGEIVLHKLGTYRYKLSEDAGSEAGYSYDSNFYILEVTLSEDAKGELIVSKSITRKKSMDEAGQALGANEKLMTFTNKYVPQNPPAISVSLDVSKALKGSPKTTADFEMRLVGKNGAPMPSGSSNGQKTVKIHGEGSASFGAITFTAPGSYVYEVSEKNAKLQGYTYDTTVYTVTVKVDNVNGVLTAAISAQNQNKQSVKWDELVFTNTYKEPAPQTGILWWPVPVLLASGLLLVLLGTIRRRKYEN